jgi:hypothetical protein
MCRTETRSHLPPYVEHLSRELRSRLISHSSPKCVVHLRRSSEAGSESWYGRAHVCWIFRPRAGRWEPRWPAHRERAAVQQKKELSFTSKPFSGVCWPARGRDAAQNARQAGGTCTQGE